MCVYVSHVCVLRIYQWTPLIPVNFCCVGHCVCMSVYVRTCVCAVHYSNVWLYLCVNILHLIKVCHTFLWTIDHMSNTWLCSIENFAWIRYQYFILHRNLAKIHYDIMALSLCGNIFNVTLHIFLTIFQRQIDIYLYKYEKVLISMERSRLFWTWTSK